MRFLLVFLVIGICAPSHVWAQDHSSHDHSSHDHSSHDHSSHNHGTHVGSTVKKVPSKKYYNVPVMHQSQGSSVYVSQRNNASSYNGVQPIMLKRVARGGGMTSSGRSGSRGGSQSYNSAGSNSFSMSLSPSQVRARQAARDRETKAQQRQNQLTAQRAEADAKRQQRDAYLSQIRSTSSRSSSSAQTQAEPKKRIIYNRPSTTSTPKRVFNTPY